MREIEELSAAEEKNLLESWREEKILNSFEEF